MTTTNSDAARASQTETLRAQVSAARAGPAATETNARISDADVVIVRTMCQPSNECEGEDV